MANAGMAEQATEAAPAFDAFPFICPFILVLCAEYITRLYPAVATQFHSLLDTYRVQLQIMQLMAAYLGLWFKDRIDGALQQWLRGAAFPTEDAGLKRDRRDRTASQCRSLITVLGTGSLTSHLLDESILMFVPMCFVAFTILYQPDFKQISRMVKLLNFLVFPTLLLVLDESMYHRLWGAVIFLPIVSFFACESLAEHCIAAALVTSMQITTAAPFFLWVAPFVNSVSLGARMVHTSGEMYAVLLVEATYQQKEFQLEIKQKEDHAILQEAQSKNNILEEQLDRLEAEIGHSALLGQQCPTSPMRIAQQGEAWTPSWREASATDESKVVDVNGICLAVQQSEDGVHFAARLLKRGLVFGKSMVLKAGSHAFVQVMNESFMRVALPSHEFGDAPGHPHLATEQEVLYAGEVEFDEDQILTRWCNLSGTYKCPDHMAFQASLPLDKFWAVSDPEGSLSDSIVHCVPNGVTLRKILAFSDEDFQNLQLAWQGRLRQWLSTDPTHDKQYRELDDAIKERQIAVKKFGYMSRAVTQAAF